MISTNDKNKTETNDTTPNPYESHTVENYRAMVHEISEIRAELRLLTQEFAQIMKERDNHEEALAKSGELDLDVKDVQEEANK